MAIRRSLIAGNWKMHCSRTDAETLLFALKTHVGRPADREIVVAPPFTALETAGRMLAGTTIRLAAQNLHWEPQGAFTGEISGAMLKELGCHYVIIGHSERRQYFGETDEHVAKKVQAAQRDGLIPIICVGETLDERESEQTFTVLSRQIHGALQGQETKALAAVVLAYEPVWAIGTGRTATPDQAQEVHAFLRTTLEKLAGRATAELVRILYGGSVKPENVDALMAEADIDGALVGGASLQAEAFARIVQFR